jgi:hypothetical protein
MRLGVLAASLAAPCIPGVAAAPGSGESMTTTAA